MTMKLSGIIVSIIFLYGVGVVFGYSSGAPSDACMDMVPNHGIEAQTIPFPYQISLSKSSIQSGESIEMTLSGGNEKKFKGFFVQVRQGDRPVGSFSQTGDVSPVNCLSGIKNAATHVSAADKISVKLYWTAPNNLKGSVTIYATVAKTGEEFWAKQPAGSFTIL